MAERKVLNKYYPPDYDPTKIPRIKKKTKQNDVRIMAPFNMRCKTCGNYIANATKFNAKKEAIDETYNTLTLYRFYIKCPRCMAPITFRTNLKEAGYEVEHGATENFMALKMAERQAKEEAEAEEEEEKINPMKHLENRTKASKQQMEASEQLRTLRSLKYRHHTVNIDSLILSKRGHEDDDEDEASKLADDKNKSEANRLLMGREKMSCIEGPSSKDIVNIRPQSSSSVASNMKKISSSLSSLKKKIKLREKDPT